MVPKGCLVFETLWELVQRYKFAIERESRVNVYLLEIVPSLGFVYKRCLQNQWVTCVHDYWHISALLEMVFAFLLVLGFILRRCIKESLVIGA